VIEGERKRKVIRRDLRVAPREGKKREEGLAARQGGNVRGLRYLRRSALLAFLAKQKGRGKEGKKEREGGEWMKNPIGSF